MYILIHDAANILPFLKRVLKNAFISNIQIAFMFPKTKAYSGSNDMPNFFSTINSSLAIKFKNLGNFFYTLYIKVIII